VTVTSAHRLADPRAFTDFYLANWKTGIGACLRLGLDIDDAQDVANGAMAVVFEAAQKGRLVTDNPVWYFRTTVLNMAKVLIRDKIKAREVLARLGLRPDVRDTDVARTVVTSPTELPHHAVVSVETTKRIVQALREMAPLYQASLGLEVDGFNPRERAEAKDIPWGTERQHTRRGREKARRIIQEQAPDVAPRDPEKASGGGVSNE